MCVRTRGTGEAACVRTRGSRGPWVRTAWLQLTGPGWLHIGKSQQLEAWLSITPDSRELQGRPCPDSTGLHGACWGLSHPPNEEVASAGRAHRTRRAVRCLNEGPGEVQSAVTVGGGAGARLRKGPVAKHHCRKERG